MDAVTTAIVAAILTEAHEQPQQAGEEQNVAAAYVQLKQLLASELATEQGLLAAIRRLESADSPHNRQALHQEVKITRADQKRAIVTAADRLLAQIKEQSGGEEAILQARTWREL